MSGSDHKMKSIHRDSLECTCGWTDDGDLTVQESIDALMRHAYETGALEATEGKVVVDIDEEATPSADLRPHSRACGIKPHAHGEECSPNCPTCGGLNWRAER